MFTVRSSSSWLDWVNLGLGVVAVVGLLLSWLSLNAANASLSAANEANTKYQLKVSFVKELELCIGLGIDANGNAMPPENRNGIAAVITNTGRQPISVVRVWSGSAEDSRFAWVPLADLDLKPAHDAPFVLDIGQAVLVETSSTASLTGNLTVLTSDGKEEHLSYVLSPRTVPTLDKAFAALPGCV